MELYVANCTKQNYIFSYRLPGEAGVKAPRIRIGQQIKVPGVHSPAQVEAVLHQHRKYGITDVREIDRTKPFIGICYSVDKQINVSAIEKAILHNDQFLQKQGRELRAQAAVASNNLIQEHLHMANEQNQTDQAELTNFSMTIEEQDLKGRRSGDEGTEVFEVGATLENAEKPLSTRPSRRSSKRAH